MATDVPGILIVDDNEDNRYTLQLLLESDGHERIASAACGKDAPRETKIQPRPARSDDARSQRGRGAQTDQE
jgi:CheY-like chemotaxis protein